MQATGETRSGVGYLSDVLKAKAKTVTRAVFWRIPHNSGAEDIRLKLGRYEKELGKPEVLQSANPKSELTLDNAEFAALVRFLQENYEPFRQKSKHFIAIDERFDESPFRTSRPYSVTPTGSNSWTLSWSMTSFPEIFC